MLLLDENVDVNLRRERNCVAIYSFPTYDGLVLVALLLSAKMSLY